jgi:two-component system, OmpR family, sensor kinase
LQINMQTRTIIAAILAMLAICGPILLSQYSLADALRQAERQKIALEVLSLHERLEDLGHEVMHLQSVQVPRTDPRSLEILEQFNATAGMIRSLIAREVGVIGAHGGEEEEEELERLAKIEREVVAINGHGDKRWVKLIADAVEEEQRELVKINQDMDEFLRNSNLLDNASIASAILVLAICLAYTWRSLGKPLRELNLALLAVTSGSKDTRVIPSGEFETRKAMQAFNKMADVFESAQTELADANSELDANLKSRSMELEAANRTLAELSEKRSAFLADVSHELRTPIAIIRGEADVALRAKAPTLQDAAESLRRISGQASMLTSLVDDLLYVARTNANGPKHRPVRTELVEIIGHAVAAVRHSVATRQGEITFHSEEKSADLFADSKKLQQLIHLLLDNAISYSEGPPRIAVSLCRTTIGYRVAVSDEGRGISEADLPHLFERFRRGGNADGVNGNGLGLPLAKAIVEAHDGQIGIERNPDAGTTFWFTLPHGRKLQALK